MKKVTHFCIFLFSIIFCFEFAYSNEMGGDRKKGEKLIALADEFYLNKDLEKAGKYYEEAYILLQYVMYQRLRDGFIKVGMAYLNNRELEKAEKYLLKASDSSGCIKLRNTYFQMNDYIGAGRLSHWLKDKEGMIKIADSCLAKGYIKEADLFYDWAHYKRGHSKIADYYYQKSDYEKAIRYYEKAVDKEGIDKIYQVFIKQGRIEEANKLLYLTINADFNNFLNAQEQSEIDIQLEKCLIYGSKLNGLILNKITSVEYLPKLKILSLKIWNDDLEKAYYYNLMNSKEPDLVQAFYLSLLLQEANPQTENICKQFLNKFLIALTSLSDKKEICEGEKITNVLAMIGKPAVSPLMNLIKEGKDPYVMAYAAVALGKIGHDATEALSLLKKEYPRTEYSVNYWNYITSVGVTNKVYFFYGNTTNMSSKEEISIYSCLQFRFQEDYGPYAKITSIKGKVIKNGIKQPPFYKDIFWMIAGCDVEIKYYLDAYNYAIALIEGRYYFNRLLGDRYLLDRAIERSQPCN